MQVETFEVLSIGTDANGHPYNEVVSEEALALVESLGLAGQQRLLAVAPAGDTDTTVTRNPWREITNEERAVYRAVMPQTTRLEDYAVGPIPLEVLRIVPSARELFDRLEVWHPAVQSDDPVLVGIMKDVPPNEWRTRTFLLARWGDVLVPFDALREKARVAIKSAMALNVRQGMHAIRALEETLDEAIEAHLRGFNQGGVYVSIGFGA